MRRWGRQDYFLLAIFLKEVAGVYARAKNIIKNGGATRGRYAGTRFYALCVLRPHVNISSVARSLMAKTVTLKEQEPRGNLLTSMSLECILAPLHFGCLYKFRTNKIK